MDSKKMMQAMQNVQVDEQSIENLATVAAEEIVQIDMTTAEYTADTCPMTAQSSDISTMPSVLPRDL